LSKEDILAFIARRPPGKVGAREIARAFGLKNADRRALQHMLKELAKEGHVQWGRRKKLNKPGTLPQVVLADIETRHRHHALIAGPTQWDEDAHGPPPEIRGLTSRPAPPTQVPRL